MFRSTLGFAPVALTVIDSLKLAVICTTSPALSVLLMMPLAPLMFMLLIVGVRVSKFKLGVLPAEPVLPAESA